jgi:hypothetical protein
LVLGELPVNVEAKVEPETAPAAATLAGVIAPSERVMAGVVVGLATVPETPLAVTTDRVVTDPPPPPDPAPGTLSTVQRVLPSASWPMNLYERLIVQMLAEPLASSTIGLGFGVPPVESV